MMKPVAVVGYCRGEVLRGGVGGNFSKGERESASERWAGGLGLLCSCSLGAPSLFPFFWGSRDPPAPSLYYCPGPRQVLHVHRKIKDMSMNHDYSLHMLIALFSNAVSEIDIFAMPLELPRPLHCDYKEGGASPPSKASSNIWWGE